MIGKAVALGIGLVVGGAFVAHTATGKLLEQHKLIAVQQELVRNLSAALNEQDAPLRAGEALLHKQIVERNRGCK